MSFSDMIEGVVNRVECCIMEARLGGETRVNAQDLLTYQYATGKSNPFDGYELTRVDEEGLDKFFVFKKQLLME